MEGHDAYKNDVHLFVTNRKDAKVKGPFKLDAKVPRALSSSFASQHVRTIPQTMILQGMSVQFGQHELNKRGVFGRVRTNVFVRDLDVDQFDTRLEVVVDGLPLLFSPEQPQ